MIDVEAIVVARMRNIDSPAEALVDHWAQVFTESVAGPTSACIEPVRGVPHPGNDPSLSDHRRPRPLLGDWIPGMDPSE